MEAAEAVLAGNSWRRDRRRNCRCLHRILGSLLLTLQSFNPGKQCLLRGRAIGMR